MLIFSYATSKAEQRKFTRMNNSHLQWNASGKDIKITNLQCAHVLKHDNNP